MKNSKVKVLAVSAFALAASLFVNVTEAKAERARSFPMPTFGKLYFTGKVINHTDGDKIVTDPKPNIEIPPGLVRGDGQVMNLDTGKPDFDWIASISFDIDAKGEATPNGTISQVYLKSETSGQQSSFQYDYVDGKPMSIVRLAKDPLTYIHVLTDKDAVVASACKNFDKATSEVSGCTKITPFYLPWQMEEAEKMRKDITQKVFNFANNRGFITQKDTAKDKGGLSVKKRAEIMRRNLIRATY